MQCAIWDNIEHSNDAQILEEKNTHTDVYPQLLGHITLRKTQCDVMRKTLRECVVSIEHMLGVMPRKPIPIPFK